jgi:hypothetical protein
VLVLCGLVALNGRLLKHAMHAAAAVGLLGLLGGAVRALPHVLQLLNGTDGSPAATRQQLWMAGICLVFVLLCVNSFIQTRRRRRAATL